MSFRAEVCFPRSTRDEDPSLSLPSNYDAEWHEVDLSIDPSDNSLAVECFVRIARPICFVGLLIRVLPFPSLSKVDLCCGAFIHF